MKIFFTNFKQRFTGVTTTAFAVAISQRRDFGADVTLVGDPLGHDQVPAMSARAFLRNVDSLASGDAPAILHVRRDSEMWFGLLARDLLRKPINLVFTSSNMRRRSWIGRWLMARMDAVIATTDAAAAALPVPAAAIIPHGIDGGKFDLKPATAQPSYGTNRITMACVGRVRPGKGTQNFVRAFIAAAPEHPSLHAIAFGATNAGDQKFRRELMDDINAAGLSDRFVWAGELHHDQLAASLAKCDILVALPQYEPFGVTPIEALSMGIPVLCSRTGCFPDVVQDGHNGFVIDHDDPQAARAALAKMLAWPLHDQDFRIRIRQSLPKRYRQQAEAQSVLALYEKIIEE